MSAVRESSIDLHSNGSISYTRHPEYLRSFKLCSDSPLRTSWNFPTGRGNIFILVHTETSTLNSSRVKASIAPYVRHGHKSLRIFQFELQEQKNRKRITTPQKNINFFDKNNFLMVLRGKAMEKCSGLMNFYESLWNSLRILLLFFFTIESVASNL